MNDWHKIYTTYNPAEAAIIRGVLEENLINTFVLNKQDSNYHLGEIEIYVPMLWKDMAHLLITRSLMN